MKKLLLLMLFGAFIFSSCYNRRHGRTNWSKKDAPQKQTEQLVKPS
jgi:hypothetical protein